MPKITLDIPDAQGPRVANAVARHYDYQPKIEGPQGDGTLIDNPENKQAFVKRMLIEHIMNIVAAQEAEEAARDARREAQQKTQNEVVIT